jgi:uncharacterized membrane protein YkvA (DUF1232 family)
MSRFAGIKAWASRVRRDILALYLAARDPRVAWYAKALAALTAAYALSPIDLIPDFIPVFGYLDDVIIVPVAILLTVRLVPSGVMAELREEAERRLAGRAQNSLTGAILVVLTWLLLTGLVTGLVLEK